MDQEDMVELETDNHDGIKEWQDCKWFLDPNHSRIIQQLEQRKNDPNLTLRVKVVQEKGEQACSLSCGRWGKQ